MNSLAMLALTVLVTAAVAGIGIYYLGPYLLEFWGHGIPGGGSAPSPRVVLTFDDGPDPRYTPRCLEILDAYQVHAAFFLIGEKVRRYPELTRQIRTRGHDLGNHTWSHRRHWLLSPQRAEVEVREGMRAIAEVSGEPPRFFRPPFGQMNLCSYRAAARLGERCVLWSLPGKDWRRGRSPGWIVRRVTLRLRGGAIILLHDSGGAEGAPDVMLKALPDIIQEAKRRGFRLVSLSEMMGEGRAKESHGE